MDNPSPRTREADKDHLIEQLRLELQAEKNKNKALHEELRQLREAQVQAQAATEQEEELITNTLMKRMNELKKDRDRLAMQVEQEEEYLTNTLQKKLRELTKEKADLEIRLAAEEEYIVNKLQRQLDDMLKEKTKLEQTVRQEHDEVEKLRQQTARLSEELAAKTTALERERKQLAEQLAKLAEQVDTLKREKALSEQRAQKEHALLSQVTADKVQLELERERYDEREFNTQLAHKLELASRASPPGTRMRSSSSAGLPSANVLASLSMPFAVPSQMSPTRKEGALPDSASGNLATSSPASTSSAAFAPLKLNLIAATAPLSPRMGVSPRSSPHASASPRSALGGFALTSPHMPASSLPHTPHLASPRLPRAGIAKNGKVLRQGWLRRRRASEGHWSRPWCQLRDNEELWSWAETVTLVSDSPIDPPEAILDLDTVKVVHIVPEGQDAHKHVFFVQGSEGTEWYALDTKEQLDEWFGLVRELCPSITKK